MALSVPTLENIYPFDANDTYDFQFSYDKGGDQYSKHNLVISTNRGDGTDSIVYDVTADSYEPFHTYVPALADIALINGKQYKAKIRLGTETAWSEFSEWKLFYVHSKPDLDIINIGEDGLIYNYIETFQGSYIHPVDEGDILVSYQFFLYDNENRLIEQFDKKYYAKTPLIEQTIKNFENGVPYKLTLKTESNHGILASVTKTFIPMYDFPIIGDVPFTLKNVPKKPSIEISFDLIQVDGEKDNEDSLIYENSTWVNLQDDKVFYDKDFLLKKDFVLKIWCKDLIEDETICKLQGVDGSIELVYSRGFIQAIKQANNCPYVNRIVSYVPIVNEIEMFICLKQLDDLMELAVEQIL